MRVSALAIGLLTVAALAAAQERPAPHLVRFTSARTELATGGHLTPECSAVLTAEIAPYVIGTAVEFAIAVGTGRGRAVPAMLSSTRVQVDEHGLARTVLLSGDAQEECCILAVTAGGPPLELRLTFHHVVPESVLVGSVRADRDPVGPHIDARVIALSAQLSDPAVEVRTTAKRRLVAMGRDAVGSLVAVASDTRVQRGARHLAVRALGEMRDEEADDQLLVLLAYPLPDVRCGAEETIARMSPDRAGPLGEAAMLTSDSTVRAAGVRIVASLQSAASQRMVLEALRDEDPFVRATAIWEVARHGGAAATDAVAAGIADKSPFVKTIAAKAVVLLGEAGPENRRSLTPSLQGLLADRAVSVRSAAVRAMASIETGPSTVLVPLFEDSDPRVRRSIALALPWRRNVHSSLRLLRRLIDDRDVTVRNVAARAIADVGGVAEMDLLVRMLDAKETDIRAMAVASMRHIACFDFGWLRATSDAERDEVRRHWRRWYASHGTEPRRVWLWQALDLPGSVLRGKAGLELARILAREPDGQEVIKQRAALAAALANILRSEVVADRLSERHATSEALMVLLQDAGLESLKADLQEDRQYVRLSASRHVFSALNFLDSSIPDGIRRHALAELIDALDDTSVSVRRSVSRSLCEYTGESLGYHAHAPAKHRARSIAEWRKWLAGPGSKRPPGRREAKR